MKPKFNRESFHFDERREILGIAHKKAREMTARYEIRPEDFIDLYQQDGVNRDLAYVKTKEAAFDQDGTLENKEKRRLAEILEAIIFEQGEQGNWFGEKATTIKTSRFDDIAGGVDLIVEFDEGRNRASHTAFAVDATYSQMIGEKFKKIKAKIDSGQLTKVKYFQSEKSSFRGELSRVPITVASAHPKTLWKLAELWVDNEKQALANHWIQFQLLEELEAQCQMFADYAKKMGNRQTIAESYRHIGDLAQEIIIQKRATVKDTGQRDDNFQQTLSDLKWFLT